MTKLDIHYLTKGALEYAYLIEEGDIMDWVTFPKDYVKMYHFIRFQMPEKGLYAPPEIIFRVEWPYSPVFWLIKHIKKRWKKYVLFLLIPVAIIFWFSWKNHLNLVWTIWMIFFAVIAKILSCDGWEHWKDIIF